MFVHAVLVFLSSHDQHVWCTYHSMRSSHCSIVVCVLTVRVVFMYFVYKNHFNLKDACPYVCVHTVILLQLYAPTRVFKMKFWHKMDIFNNKNRLTLSL